VFVLNKKLANPMNKRFHSNLSQLLLTNRIVQITKPSYLAGFPIHAPVYGQ